MTKEDFSVKVDDYNNLIIAVDKKSGTEKHDEETCYLRREFTYSHFQRHIILPDTVVR